MNGIKLREIGVRREKKKKKKKNFLKIPTGGMLTGTLFTKCGEVTFGTTKQKSIPW